MGRREDIQALEAIRDGLGAISQLRRRYENDRRYVESITDNLLRNASREEQEIIGSDYFTSSTTVYFDTIPVLSAVEKIWIKEPNFTWKDRSYRFGVKREALPFWRFFLSLHAGIQIDANEQLFTVAFTPEGFFLTSDPRIFGDLKKGKLYRSTRAMRIGKDLFDQVTQTNIDYLKWAIINRIKKFKEIYDDFSAVKDLMSLIPATHPMSKFDPDSAEDQIDEVQTLLEDAQDRLAELKKNPGNNSLSRRKREAQEWMVRYARQAEAIRQLLISRYSCYLLEKDWGSLDLILDLLLSNRAASIPEAFRIISENIRHDQLLNTINAASDNISRELINNRITSIENTKLILNSLSDVRSRIDEIPASISDLAVQSQQQAVTTSSSQMERDVRFMAQMAEEAEIRRRNNVK